MPDRELVIDGTYRHFRGELYKVLEEAKAQEDLLDGFFGIIPWLGSYKVLINSDIKKGQQIILYRKLSGDVVFVREKEEFLEVLGDKKEGTMYYRFEFVADVNKINVTGLKEG